MTPGPARPCPAPSHSRDQDGEGQPGSAAARLVLGTAGSARPRPAPAVLPPAAHPAVLPRRSCSVPRPRSHSTPQRPAPAPRPAREEEPRRGGGGGRGLREGARPHEPPAVRITGVGRRSPAGPADQRRAGGRRGGGGRKARGCELGRGRPPTSAALRSGLGGLASPARRPGSHQSPPRASPRGRLSVEVRTRGAGLRAEAWTARPGDGGPLCFSRGKGTPRAAVPPGCPSKPFGHQP